jgi:hypothetical protein
MTLIEIQHLTAQELANHRAIELQKQLSMLTAKSYFREALEICSRLRHLQNTFHEFVEPSVVKLPDASNWSTLFRMLDEHEGAVIPLVEGSATKYLGLLSQVDEASLPALRDEARKDADAMKAALVTLRDLNTRIVGLSGRTGFLEITQTREAIEREISIMIDNRNQSTNVNISNSTTGDVNVSSTHDSTVQVTDQQAIVKKLEDAIAQLTASLAADKAMRAQFDLELIAEQAGKQEPDKSLIKRGWQGLLSVAKSVGEVGAPLLGVLSQAKTIFGL